MKNRPSQVTSYAFLMCLIVSFILSSPSRAARPLTSKQTDDRGLRLHSGGSVSKWPSSTKRWALIIGVDNYDDKHIRELSGAANDARALARVLEKNAGFPPNQIIVLASDQTNERRPTRSNILREMSDLASALPKDGLLFVAFSGHGIERNQQVILLPSDAQVKDMSLLEQTSIPATLIADWFRTSAQQVLIIVDACRSNPTREGEDLGKVKRAAGRPGAFPLKLSPPTLIAFNYLFDALRGKAGIDERNEGIVAFAILYATESGKTAYENAESRHGYLTSAVVRALEGGAANNDGNITLAGLIRYVQDMVPKTTEKEMGKQQRPFYSMEGYKPEDLVIAVVR